MKKDSSSHPLLLDVNVLLAVAWPNHQFHPAALEALSSGHRWATCALTQLGFIRLSTNRAVIPSAKSPQHVLALLAQLVADPLHIYFDVLPQPAAEDWQNAFVSVRGHQQITDAYLLRLAAAQNAVLVTFDRRLSSLADRQSRVLVLK